MHMHWSKYKCRVKHTEKNLFMNRASWAQVHRHLLDLFPLTWGRHLAIQSPPSLYQQEGALRRCCSSEPAQLDTKHCREPLSFTPAEREKKIERRILQQFRQDSSTAASVSYISPGWAGGWKCVCVYVQGQEKGTHYRSKHRTQRHNTLHSSTAC